jgi:methyltransferase
MILSETPVGQILAAALLLLATVQRLIELVLARRNAIRLLAEGAYEVGRGHYPVLVTLHVAWLGSLWALLLTDMAGFVAWAAIAYLAVQGLRIWTLASLGRYWTTRIIVAPDAPLVRKGPYRFLRHPNYLVVVLEIALLPLALDWWQLAAGFTAANGLALAWRIAVEEATLAARRRPHIKSR